MKHAGSVRLSISCWMLKFSVLLCLAAVSKTLTPPRIIYGGWTPILPGHPFYFGPIHARTYHQNPIHYADPGPFPHGHFHEPPIHQVEHHFEHHVEFVNPEQYHRNNKELVQYRHYNKEPEQYIHYNKEPEQYQQYGKEPKQYQQYNKEPEQYQQYNKEPEQYQQYNKEPEQYQQYKKELEQYKQYSKEPEKYQHYNKEPEQYQQYNKKPEQYNHYQKEPEVHPHSQPPHAKTPIKGQQLYGNKPKKDIFSYYPPQSAYEKPKTPEFGYKPIYFEVPRKPLDVLENPQKHIHYNFPPLKDLPISNLNLHDLKSTHFGGENKFFEVTPLGNIDSNALKHIGHIHFDQIQYLDPNVLPKHTKYPVIKDSSGGTPKRPVPLSYTKQSARVPQQNFAITNAKHAHAGVANVPYDVNHPKSHQSTNNYKGTEFQLGTSYSVKPLTPIDTKNLRNHILQSDALNSGKPGTNDISNIKLNNYNTKLQHSSVPVRSPIPGPHLYPTKPDIYSNIKYLPHTKSSVTPLMLSKHLLSPALINKNVLANQMKNYFGPKFPYYSPVQPLYPYASPRPLHSVVGYPNLYPRTHLPLRILPKPLSPQLLPNYLHKDVKLQTLYKNPSVVTNIQGSPAIVEREVAIIHVPVTDQQGYVNQKDFLYHTASTPKSTQILDVVKLNESTPYVTLNKHMPSLKNNESYTHITLDYGKGQDLQHVTFVTADHQIDSSPENDNDISDHYQDHEQYIFVSSNEQNIQNAEGSYSEGGNKDHSSDHPDKKQFFHAYYAPSDHVPPPGYVKMTVEEFNHLFKNAEIRYVDKDTSTISQNNEGHGK